MWKSIKVTIHVSSMKLKNLFDVLGFGDEWSLATFVNTEEADFIKSALILFGNDKGYSICSQEFRNGGKSSIMINYNLMNYITVKSRTQAVASDWHCKYFLLPPPPIEQ